MKPRQGDDRNQTLDYMKFDEIMVLIDDDQYGDRLVVLQTGSGIEGSRQPVMDALATASRKFCETITYVKP